MTFNGLSFKRVFIGTSEEIFFVRDYIESILFGVGGNLKSLLSIRLWGWVLKKYFLGFLGLWSSK